MGTSLWKEGRKAECLPLAQSKLISQAEVSKPQIYCKYSFGFDISKSIQAASLELVNTQIATSNVDLLCCNEFGFNRIM